MKHKTEPGKINENSYLIDMEMMGLPGITSVFAVEDEKTVLIDGGTASEAEGLIESLKDFDLMPLDYIVISHAHWDHFQAVPDILEELSDHDVEVLAHPDAVPLLKDPSEFEYDFGVETLRPIDEVNPIEEGDKLDLGETELEIIETPGHTPDCISLLDSGNGNIFVSDAVADMTDESTYIPAFMPPSFDSDAYLSTLEKLRGIDFESICLGHFGMYYGPDVKDILDQAEMIYEATWEFMEENSDKLDDVEWVTNQLVERYMPESETIQNTPDLFAQTIVDWLIDGFKMARES